MDSFPIFRLFPSERLHLERSVFLLDYYESNLYDASGYNASGYNASGYKGLSYFEYSAINGYMDKNDPAALGRLIQQDDQLTPDFRRFIADFVTGKIKRPIKKASTLDRDYEIYMEIGIDIRSGHSLKTAAERIAGRINLSVDAINKAYYRGKIVYNESIQQQEEWERLQKAKQEEAEYYQTLIEYFQEQLSTEME